MNKNAQASLSYILLIGGAVLVAAIAIAIIVSVPNSSNTGDQLYCASKTPFNTCATEARCAPTKGDGSLATSEAEFLRCGGACTLLSETITDTLENGTNDVVGAPGLDFETDCRGSSCAGNELRFLSGPFSGQMFTILFAMEQWAILTEFDAGPANLSGLNWQFDIPEPC